MNKLPNNAGAFPRYNGLNQKQETQWVSNEAVLQV